MLDLKSLKSYCAATIMKTGSSYDIEEKENGSIMLSTRFKLLMISWTQRRNTHSGEDVGT